MGKVCPRKIPIESGRDVCWLQKDPKINGERRHCGEVSEDRACEPGLVAIDEYAFMRGAIVDQKCIQLKYMRKPKDIPFIYRITDGQKLNLFQRMARHFVENALNRARLQANISEIYPKEARQLNARLEHLEIGVTEVCNEGCLFGSAFFIGLRSPRTNTIYNVWIVDEAGKGNEFKMVERLMDLIQMRSEAVFAESF
jgi:hypothetical protein